MIRFSTILSILFILLFASMLNLSFLTNYDDGVASLSGPWGTFKLISRILFMLTGLYFLVTRANQFYVAYKGPVLFLLLFFLISFMSLSYSSDRVLSLIRLVEHVGIFIGVVALWLSIASERRENHVLNLILIGCCFLIFVVWCFVLIVPVLAFRELGTLGPVLGGSVLHSHTLGHCAVYLMLLLLSRWNEVLRSRLGFLAKIGSAAFLIATVALTQSRSSVVILLVGVSLILMSRSSATYRLVNVRRYLFVVMSISTFILLLPYGYEMMIRDGDISNFTTLGSRSLIWSTIASQVLNESPLLGYGYQMLSLNGSEFELVPGVMRGMAHNAYIQTLAGLGIMGFVVILIQSGITYSHIFRPPKLLRVSLDQNSKRNYALVAVVCLGSSLSEFGMVGPTSPTVPIYFVLVVYASLITRTRYTVPDRLTNKVHRVAYLNRSQR